MLGANKTKDSIRELRSAKLTKGRPAEATIRMKSVAGVLHSRRKERNRSKFADWVARMVTGTVGKLHSWSKAEDQTGGMAVMWDEMLKAFNTDPHEVLGERRHDWASIWQCGSKEARSRTNNATKAAIERAKVEGSNGALITSRKK